MFFYRWQVLLFFLSFNKKLTIMKNIILTICAVLIAAIYSNVTAQSEAEMKAWMEYMTPGDFHKEMAKWDGEWNEDITMWMAPLMVCRSKV
jgi:hypothetical protein